MQQQHSLILILAVLASVALPYANPPGDIIAARQQLPNRRQSFFGARICWRTISPGCKTDLCNNR